jgi:hypothetical protein
VTQHPTRHGEPVQPADPDPGVGQDQPAATGQVQPFDVRLEQPVTVRSEPPSQRAPQFGDRTAPGAVIGDRYALRTAIGHGGMGTVWRASDTLLRRDVAVKEVLLPPGIADSDREQMYLRTLREARAAAALSHPSVVQVYDVVTENGRPWIVMELLQSRSLAEMIIEDGPLAARAVAKIGIALVGALEVAHANGVLHRDVKPANVLICSDGRCVLTDFGVARMPADAQLTTPGMVLGSPHFISPERAIGAKFGPPSDLFSLGVTLYTAVEGQPPFDKRDPFETMRAIVEEPPAAPMRAGSLTGVLYGLLEKDPARRWDVQATRKVLRELLAGPLASNSAVHVTDPYAVVRPAPYPPPAATSVAAGQIGGKAMLAPGESVSGAIRRRSTGTDYDGQDPAAAGASLDVATGAYAGPAQVAPAQRTSPEYGQQQAGGYGQPAGPGCQPYAGTAGLLPSRTRAGTGSRGPPRWSAPRWRGGWPRPSRRRARPMAAAAVRRAPRWAQVVGTAALARAVRHDRRGDRPVQLGQAGDHDPAGQDQPLADRAAIHYPGVPRLARLRGQCARHLDQKQYASYVDFTDPADESRRLRINVEKASSTAQKYMEIAEGLLRKNGTSCPAPYVRVALVDVSLDGHPASELEYTCGTGDQMRHGIWRTFVQGGNAYQFFVSVPDRRFQESKAVYDEMVRTYHLNV